MVAEVHSEQERVVPPWRSRGLLVEQGKHAQMAIGLTVMAMGLVLLLGRFGIIPVTGLWHLWPLLLIGLGIGKLSTSYADRTRHGTVLVIVGVWLLCNELRIWRAEDSWPLLLVAFGLRIVWKAVSGAAREAE